MSLRRTAALNPSLSARRLKQDRPFRATFAAALKASLAHFPRAILRHPAVLLFLVGYGLLHIFGNLSLGASLFTALRSTAIGMLSISALVIVVDTIHYLRLGSFTDASRSGTAWERRHPGVLATLLVFWLFWGLDIISGLQRQDLMPGSPVLAYLPGWSALQDLFARLGVQLHALWPVIEARAYESLADNLLLRLLPLLLILWLAGCRRGDSGLTLRHWQVAAPLLVIYLLLFALNGLTVRSLAYFGVIFVYPGLTEELFYRGLLQRALSGWLRPGSAVLLAAVFFGLLHVPSFYYAIYDQNALQAAMNVSDVILTGLFWGYGYLRSGSVLPWAAIHALSDIVGV